MSTENLTQYKKREDFKTRIKGNKIIKVFYPAEKFIHLNIIRPAATAFYCFKRCIHCLLLDKNIIKKNENEKAIEALKDSHKGETAFIIGNGPSLRTEDLELLKEYGAYSFACNRISVVFDETDWRPSCYAAIDRRLLFSEGYVREMLENAGCEYYFFWSKFYDCMPEELKKENVISIEQKPTNPYKAETGFSAEPLKYLISGYTVTNLSLQMAVYMGFTTLCLLGVDCKYANEMDAKGNIKHHDGVNSYFKVKEKDTNKNTAFTGGMLQAYANAKKYAEEHNIEIYNCSGASPLEVFEKKDLLSVLKKM